MNVFLSFNWMIFLLSSMTGFFVVTDRAFSKKVRIKFIVTISLCFYMSLLSQHLRLITSEGISTTKSFVFGSEIILLPIVMFLFFSLFTNLKRGKTDYIFAGVAGVMFVISVASGVALRDINSITSTLCVTVCIYYFYCVTQTYKKDRLTKLLLRHNLNFEMADLSNKCYDLVLMDVDNFKLINDKYGHDKGDEVLVTVVDTIKRFLPKGCRMYRFGGDEFVIISTKVVESELIRILEDSNRELSSKNLRVSYGIKKHNPGDDGKKVLTEADLAMYENKRQIKSENIWDDMTGQFNYQGFTDELDLLRHVLKKENRKLVLVAVDIERLNNINMAFGYTEGNAVIKAIARILDECPKGRGFVGHLGSDEFVIAIECENSDDGRVESFVEQMQDAVTNAYEFENKDYTVKLNIGSYYIDEEEKVSSEDHINRVLYIKQEDKDNRRKRDISEDEQDYNPEEEKIVKDIIDNNKLRYAFQPIVSAKDGTIVAYESLMRSDTDVMVSPLKILKYAEKLKRSYDIEKYTFFNVLSRITENGDFPEGAGIFINSIPGFGLSDSDYSILRSKYSSLLKRMVIEITEQREVDDSTLAVLNVRRDRDGFNLAIDDYGSGYSNTNSLLRYMPQVVKLDRLLITGIDRNAKKQFFVNSIISFARDNDMKILAEGVETESELKTVIRLGVDMIQGYFTAKPSFEIIESIPDDVKKIIIDENLKVGNNQRMIYTASGSCELSAVHLAMEDYTKINISGEYVTLVGNAEYTADMVVKIKDGAKCHLTLSDVKLNSVDDEPCIDIGEGADLTIRLEGDNRLNYKGIRVPEGSSLTIVGPGNLEINTQGHECYAIGNDTESSFGKIILKGSGIVTLNVDGENCVGIGGGIATDESEISIQLGGYRINVAGVIGVAIGCYKGSIPLHFRDFALFVEFRINKGIIMGCMDGEQQIELQGFKFHLTGSGTQVCGIGSINKSGGSIRLSSGEYIAKLNGQKLFLLGCKEGELNIDTQHVRLDMIGEGDNVVGFGSLDKNSHLHVSDCSLDLTINASSPLGFGVVEKEFGFRGKLATANINGESMDMASPVY